MKIIVEPDPMAPGKFRVCVESLAGRVPVGQRLVKSMDKHPSLERITTTWPMGLDRTAADSLANDWRISLKDQAA